jgi:hypothetical protein
MVEGRERGVRRYEREGLNGAQLVSYCAVLCVERLVVAVVTASVLPTGDRAEHNTGEEALQLVVKIQIIDMMYTS